MAGLIICVASAASGAEVDLSKLPPAAAVRVNFDRDIRPIFQRSCIRCHGPEKPKSHFQLTDRASALKGGNENTNDIVPGDSGHSYLVHYTAGLVEDMQMPPPGKGEPLTPAEVGLIRAWIDQGAPWGVTPTFPQSSFAFEPVLRWISVEGDQAKFRELTGLRPGFGGGIQHFSLEERDAPDRAFQAEGHFLFSDQDYQLKLQWTKNDVGFIRAGFDRWRRYYDDTGGYAAGLRPSSFDLHRDLYLDIGDAWMDVGLTRPDWPTVVLGYEYQFRNGAKSMLAWGDVNGADPSARNIRPAAKGIDESTHILKLDISREFGGWRVEDQARAEFFRTKTSMDTVKDQITFGPPDAVIRTREEAGHVQGQNALRLERKVADWLTLHGGYLYSHLDGDASLRQATMDTSGVPAAGLFWNTDEILLKREVHAASLDGLWLPFGGLSVSTGVQGEWSRQESAGRVNFDEGVPGQQFTNRMVESDLDRQKYSEEIGARYTGIPWTLVFAETRLDQERIGQFERQLGDEFIYDDLSFLRDTDYANDRRDCRVGFSTSPWRWIALSAHARNSLSESDYNHRSDLLLGPGGGVLVDPGTGLPIANEGYSAFIRHRKIETDEIQAQLILRPASWVKTTLTYRLVSTDFRTDTDPVPGFDPSQGTIVPGFTSPGGQVLAARYDAHIYGVSVVVTPIQRLYLSGALTYSDSRTASARNGNRAVAPYAGDVYTVSASMSYALNTLTAVNAAYAFSRAAYGQNNAADGLPLGLDYTQHRVTAGVSRKLSERVTLNVSYRFDQYREPSTGGFNDFTAHGVFAVLAFKWL